MESSAAATGASLRSIPCGGTPEDALDDLSSLLFLNFPERKSGLGRLPELSLFASQLIKQSCVRLANLSSELVSDTGLGVGVVQECCGPGGMHRARVPRGVLCTLLASPVLSRLREVKGEWRLMTGVAEHLPSDVDGDEEHLR